MNLPYLQSERDFRRYEPFVRKVVEPWPLVTAFTPEPPVASVETLSSRIRIAIKSLRDNQWTIDWNMAKFIQICDEIVVSTTTQSGKVTCGPHDLIRKATALDVSVEKQDTVVSTKINLIEPHEELIAAVFVMHHHQIFIEPSTIKTPINLVIAAAKYDVSIT